MQVNEPDRRGLDGSVIYRSAMNVKIQRNFEVFTPSDFIAAITQHIPEKSFQLVRYYGWYSNKMRGQRDKRAAEEIPATGNAVAVIDVSEHEPRRIPSAKWRELIKKVWKPTRCSARNVPVKCASSRSSTTGKSSNASCATSDCGYRACASPRHARHRNRTNGSSNPPTMTRSPTTTPNQLWRRRTAEPSRQERSAAQR